MDDDINPLILIEKTDDAERVKFLTNTNRNYVVWDNQNQTRTIL